MPPRGRAENPFPATWPRNSPVVATPRRRRLARGREASHHRDVEAFRYRGRRIAYELVGPPAAPPVVFVHGGLLDRRSWDPQVEALRSERRVLTWDLPGHGDSESWPEYSNVDAADALASLMTHVGLSSATIVGLSIGGYVAQELALRHPERVSALACFATTPVAQSRLPAPVAWLFRWSWVFIWPVPFGLVRFVLALVLARTRAGRRYVAAASARVPKPVFSSFWSGASRGLRFDPAARLPRPLLIAHGAGELVGPVRFLARRWHRDEPGSELVIVPSAGHVANLDNAAFVNELLRRFSRVD